MMKSRLALIGIFLLASVQAATFTVDCRDRSPELIPTRNGCLGPVAVIVETALLRQGHKVKWQQNNWNTTIQNAETGDIDLVIRHSMNPEREAFLHEIAYGYEIRLIYYYSAPGRSQKIRTLSDLNGLTIGAKEGSFYSPEFERNTQVIKKLYPETADVAQALEQGEIDVAITSEAHGLERFQVIKGAIPAEYTEKFYNGRYISIPKASRQAKFFNAFEAEIIKMVDDGEISQIFEQYGLPAPFQLPQE